MRCAICRTAETKKCIHGEKRKMYLCDRCKQITAVLVGTGIMHKACKAMGMSDGMIADSTIGTLLERKLVDEEDVMEVSE